MLGPVAILEKSHRKEASSNVFYVRDAGSTTCEAKNYPMQSGGNPVPQRVIDRLRKAHLQPGESDRRGGLQGENDSRTPGFCKLSQTRWLQMRGAHLESKPGIGLLRWHAQGFWKLVV